jgi:hypothetical protein
METTVKKETSLGRMAAKNMDSYDGYDVSLPKSGENSVYFGFKKNAFEKDGLKFNHHLNFQYSEKEYADCLINGKFARQLEKSCGYSGCNYYICATDKYVVLSPDKETFFAKDNSVDFYKLDQIKDLGKWITEKKENINQLNQTTMSTKNYVGNSYKTVTEKGTFYNFEVSKEAIGKIEGTGKRNEVYLAIEPKEKVEEKHPTHSVYVGDKHTKRELQLIVSKDELLKAPVDAYGNIRAFAASRDEEKIGADLSNYSVVLEQKDPDGKYQFIGRGYDDSMKFGETRVMGVAFKTEFGTDGTDGKVYNVNLDVDKVGKLTVNEHGDARLGIVPYMEKVPGADGKITEETRYLVTETNGKSKGVEATLAIHVTNPKDKKYPTIDSCAVHKVGDKEVYKLVVQDRKPESIGKDCADLTVSENKYTSEMKNLSEAERKAALGEKNYVGRGWTNDPDKIRIDRKEDLTPKGLTAAIDNNHTVKVIAILKEQPRLVRESHIKQIEARNKEGLKTSPALIEKVKQTFDTLNSKQKKSNGPKLK